MTEATTRIKTGRRSGLTTAVSRWLPPLGVPALPAGSVHDDPLPVVSPLTIGITADERLWAIPTREPSPRLVIANPQTGTRYADFVMDGRRWTTQATACWIDGLRLVVWAGHSSGLVLPDFVDLDGPLPRLKALPWEQYTRVLGVDRGLVVLRAPDGGLHWCDPDAASGQHGGRVQSLSPLREVPATAHLLLQSGGRILAHWNDSATHIGFAVFKLGQRDPFAALRATGTLATIIVGLLGDSVVLYEGRGARVVAFGSGRAVDRRLDEQDGPSVDVWSSHMLAANGRYFWRSAFVERWTSLEKWDAVRMAPDWIQTWPGIYSGMRLSPTGRFILAQTDHGLAVIDAASGAFVLDPTP